MYAPPLLNFLAQAIYRKYFTTQMDQFNKTLTVIQCLDLRVGDISAIYSSVKGWLYQDMLIKPQEIIMYRQPE